MLMHLTITKHKLRYDLNLNDYYLITSKYSVTLCHTLSFFKQTIITRHRDANRLMLSRTTMQFW